MDFIFEIVALIFRAIAWLLFRAFFGLCQAIAGILYPAQNPKMVLYQRCTAGITALSIGLLLTGILLVNVLRSGSHGYIVIGVAFIVMIIAGAVGNMAEQESERNGTEISHTNRNDGEHNAT